MYLATQVETVEVEEFSYTVERDIEHFGRSALTGSSHPFVTGLSVSVSFSAEIPIELPPGVTIVVYDEDEGKYLVFSEIIGGEFEQFGLDEWACTLECREFTKV